MTNTKNTTSFLTSTVAAGPVLVTCTHDTRAKRWVVETLDAKVTFLQRMGGGSTREWFKTTRAYGALAAFNGKAWDDRETELLRDAWDREASGELTGKCPVLARHHREGLKVAKAGLDSTLPVALDVLRQLDFSVSAGEFVARWSLKAGCSCPCSPGHVLSERVVVDGRPVDVWFD